MRSFFVQLPAPAPLLLSTLLLAAASAGCSNDTVIGGGGMATSGAGGSASSGSTGPTGEWTTLIDGTWQLAAGTEGYWCTRKTIAQDVYVKAFRALAPTGTHHTLLLRSTGGQPDGEQACGPTLGADMIHASGVGTDDLTFPEGVAVKIPAGTQLLLNLHLFNVATTPIQGVSGTLVQMVPANQVQQAAEMVLGGTMNISVPPNGTQTTSGVCHFSGPSTISTVWPHMHQYGTHMKVTYEGAGASKVLHDGPFAFGEQINHPIDPLTVAAGEGVRIECTYQNETPNPVSFGDSSKAEMCFAGLYRYPALGTGCQ